MFSVHGPQAFLKGDALVAAVGAMISHLICFESSTPPTQWGYSVAPGLKGAQEG